MSNNAGYDIRNLVNDDAARATLSTHSSIFRQVAVPHAKSGILAGLRLAVKDIFDVAGYPTGCGNPQQARRSGACPAQCLRAFRSLLDVGRAVRRQDADGRACLLDDGPERAFPPPVNPRAPDRVHRRLVLRVGGGGRRRAGRHRARFRHRRLGARAGELLRSDRAEDDAWPHPARRARCRWRPPSTRSAGSPTTSDIFEAVGECPARRGPAPRRLHARC